MLEKISETLATFVKGAKEARSIYNETVKNTHSTYRKEADCVPLDNKARRAYLDTLNALYKGIEDVPSQIKKTAEIIDSALLKPIPEDLDKLIRNYETLKTDHGTGIQNKDIDILLKQSEHSFVGRRMIEMKFNLPKEVFVEYENVKERIDFFDDAVNRLVMKPYQSVMKIVETTKVEEFGDKAWNNTIHDMLPNLDNYNVRVLLHSETTEKWVKEINDFITKYELTDN